MGALSQQEIVVGGARVVSNGVTPPNGYVFGQVGAPTHSGTGQYQFPTADGSTPVSFSPQEYEADVGLEGSTGGQWSIQWATPDANHFQINTFGGDGTAANKDFKLSLKRTRTPGQAG